MTGNLNDSVVERELHRFSRIVEQHAKDLKIIKETLEPYALPPWQPKKDMINFKLEPFEIVSDFSLIKTDNLLLNKTVLVLTSLCKEMADLANEAEKDFFIPIAIYGDSGNSNKDSNDFPHLTFSKILPVLDHINSYFQHVKKVVWNVTLQLSALHSDEIESFGIHAGAAHFQVVFEHLGKLLGTLIILDEILSNNATLQNHFALYKKLLKSSLTDPSSVSSTKKEMINLKNFISDINNQVMSGAIYKKFLTGICHNNSSLVSKNSCLKKEMDTVIHGWSSQIEDVSSDGWWCEFKGQVVSITALSVFYQVLFDVQDKRIAKELISLFKKVPCITVAVNHVWMGEKYLNTQFPSLFSLEKKVFDSLFLYRKNYLMTKIQTLGNDIQVNRLKVLEWSTRIEVAAKKPASLLTKQDLDRRAYLLWQGLILASNLKYTSESVIGLHTAIGQPMSKTCVLLFCQLIELLKAIEQTYHSNTSMLVDTLPHLRQYLGYQLLTLLKNTKARAKSERKLNKRILDVLSSLSLAEEALSGNGNLNRLLISRVSLSLANQEKIIADDDFALLLGLLRRLSIAGDVQEMVRKATCSAFLFQHQIILKIYLQDYFENFNSCTHKIHYMLAAVNDCEYMLLSSKHLPEREKLLEKLHKETEDLLKQELLDKLCKAVETALRLRSHSHLRLNKENPFEKPLDYYYPLIHLQPLSLFGSFYNVKDYVEKYLEKTFYNLTVVAPHDCGTYELMRNLAYSNLGLITVNSHLPTHTLDQGVDVLEIMRNIDVFVQHYQYNLNQQFFVEINSNNKHLNTVTIAHIANSIRTHGMGIINTTVNFTYQFLRRKFQVFSQFLYDEHIKSRLLKDLQFWKQVKEKEISFPYERANKFHRGIRKLGLSADGLSYLDKFRKLVTHIGNAIGYVRLVRSGCLHCSSAATQFIPDLQEVVAFNDLCQDDIVDGKTVEAARNLDAILANLTGHFQKETDYFKIMVDVFSTSLRDSKNSHLKNFYLIVPALTINYIEYFLGEKENIFKKNRDLGSFTDDGFAIGVAYILKVLDQIAAFESLHWWSGVRRKFIAEKEQAEKECGKTKEGDSKLEQTLSLTLRRLNDQQKTFELLFLGVSSAQVFFRGTDEEET